MANTNKVVCSMLAAYFQYQRDIGVEDIVFGQGFDVRAILTGRANRPAARAVAAVSGASAQAHGRTSAGQGSGQSAPRTIASPPVGSAGSGLSKLAKIRTVDTLDIPQYERAAASSAHTPPSSAPRPKVNSPKREKLAELYREVAKCDKCELAKERAKVVFGTGSADGRILIVGDVPTAQDEAAGLPFKGEAGELLEKILAKMGLDKGVDVFVTHLQKCRGIGFDSEHAATCRQILDKQIDIIQPKSILIFGQQAANIILENEIDIEFLRGADHIYKNTPTVVTYGLSLMVDTPALRHGAWGDMKRVG